MGQLLHAGEILPLSFPGAFFILCFEFKVVERLRSCEAACELLEKYNMSYTQETNWMDELDSKLRNLEELEEARAKEAWEKHVVSTEVDLTQLEI